GGPTSAGSAISGATAASLTVANVQPADARNYDCIVSNACCSVTSNAVSLALTDSCRNWSQVATTGPSQRQQAKMVYDAAHQVSILFGGLTLTGSYPAETWAWNGSTWTIVAMT